MKQKIELLAPAGNLESLLAAVHSGADAVYFGYGELNARRNAKNFDEQSLAEASRICKERGVKMHMTVNTMVYDREYEAVLRTLEIACKYGIDALIVQDLGVAALVRRAAPEMPLHASTQLTVHNVSGAWQAKELGFSRVVLAREMSRSEIAAITRTVPIETEVFVHGALCMCVSGQCYMSSVIGERSGNRGLCAQPCRLPFASGRKGDSGYALSLKDLSLARRVRELSELGVDSFKIEGRMKRPEYVAAAVSQFKQALRGEQADLDLMAAVFSRSGFTQGYFDGKLGPEMFGTRQKEDVLAGQKVLKSLSDLASKDVPRVGVDFAFSMKADEPVTLTASDGEGHRATVQGEPPQAALKAPTNEELVRRSLEKTGGTFYYLNSLTAELDEGLICPASQLNALRRQALDELTAQRGQILPKPFSPAAAYPRAKASAGLAAGWGAPSAARAGALHLPADRKSVRQMRAADRPAGRAAAWSRPAQPRHAAQGGRFAAAGGVWRRREGAYRKADALPGAGRPAPFDRQSGRGVSGQKARLHRAWGVWAQHRQQRLPCRI